MKYIGEEYAYDYAIAALTRMWKRGKIKKKMSIHKFG
jgi:hypothetical protein